METGFYLQAHGEEDFNFLMGLPEKQGTDLYYILHGYCDICADILHKQFGYPMEYIIDENGDLVHAYCYTKVDGEKHYIDVRGITTDYQSFLSDFEDFILDAEMARRNTMQGNYPKWVENEELYNNVKFSLMQYKDFYDVQKYL